MDRKTYKTTSKTIRFPSKDSVTITADLYEVEPSKGFILLCHRSNSNRGEYQETAPKFNELGYSAIAIDQRSGMSLSGVVNETSSLAKREGLPTGYLDAIPDVESAVEYTFQINNDQPIIILGSSYSAAISLFVALYSENIKTVIVFSPGEFLTGIDLSKKLQSLEKPVFVTCAKQEILQVDKFLKHMGPKHVTFFKPQVEGFHGSKALWASTEGHEAYWSALEDFLNKIDRAGQRPNAV